MNLSNSIKYTLEEQLFIHLHSLRLRNQIDDRVHDRLYGQLIFLFAQLHDQLFLQLFNELNHESIKFNYE
jgi:hypothetical protein